MIALALALLLQREPLPGYTDASRCAGLAISHHRRLGHDDPASRAAFDVSLFWSLTVGERARKDGVPHAQFERDLAAAADRAARELAAKDPAAAAELDRCAARVPR